MRHQGEEMSAFQSGLLPYRLEKRFNYDRQGNEIRGTINGRSAQAKVLPM